MNRIRKTFLASSLLFCFAGAKAQDVNGVLEKIKGSLSLQVWRFDNANKITGKEKVTFINKTEGALKTQDAEWKTSVSCLQQTTDGAVQLNIKFTLLSGTVNNSSAAIDFNFTDWSVKNYVMIPAVVYNGNRFPALKGGYMPPYSPDMFFNKNVPLTISDNPRLALHEGELSKIDLLTWNASTPAMSFYSPSMHKAFVVLTEPKTKWGINGLSVEENADRSKAGFTVTAPGVREYAANFGGFSKSNDKPCNWKAGDEIEMKLYVYVFNAADIPSFLQTYMDKRKGLLGETPQYYVAPMSAIFHYTSLQVDNARLHKPPFYDTMYFPENSFTRFQLGWIGGLMNTYPVLSVNDQARAKWVANTFDFVTSKMQGKSGFFYGVLDNGTTLVPEREIPFSIKAKHPEIVSNAMVRKNGDALLWMYKHFLLYKELNRANEIKPEWEASARRLAQAFVNTFEKEGELGQYVDPESGKIVVYNSAAISSAPAGLALASIYCHEPKFLKAAEAIADSYYNRFTKTLGLTGGNCGDISMDPDSESAFGLLESFMALYWATGKNHWLDLAKAEAALGSTWTVSYNYEFPKQSDLGSFDAHSTGAVWASTQNKHAAPGICSASGDYLFKLYRATGDIKVAQLLKDIVNGHTEQVELPNRPTVSAGVKGAERGTKIGCSMERVQISDAEGRGVIGKLYNGSNGWTELNGLLMSLELPGIYLQTDKNEMFVFDQVQATSIKQKDGTTLVSIKNPTSFDASVSLFAETSKQSVKPLSYTAFVKWPKVAVSAGQEVTVQISNDGTIKNIQAGSRPDRF
jgi:hypothetical protein